MTNTNTVALLVAYGDALEATYPAPTDTENNSAEHRWALTLAFAVVVVVLAAFAALSLNRDSTLDTADGFTPASFVFEAETVLRDEPLVVAAARLPEPSFDTSGLGKRVEYKSIDELEPQEQESIIDAVLAQIDLNEPQFLEMMTDLQVRKVSILGVAEDGVLAVGIVDSISATDLSLQPVGSAFRTRVVVDATGLGAGSGPIADPNDPTLLRPPPTIAEHRARVSPSAPYPLLSGSNVAEVGIGSVEIEVALEVSVVQLVISGQPTSWMVPIDGVAVLPGDFRTETPIEIVAYGHTGEELARLATTPSPG